MTRARRTVVPFLMSNLLLAQGMYWESSASGTMGQTTEKHYYAPKMFKTNNGGKDIMIVRLDKEVLWSINPATKTYSEVSFQEMEEGMAKASGKMNDAVSKMQKELASMPPEQRKMVEQMMKDKMPGTAKASTPVEVRNTGEKMTISGFACTKYQIVRGEEVVATLWTTSAVKEFAGMKTDFEAFSKRMAAMMPSGADLGQAFAKVEGFPVQTEMGKTYKSTVIKLEKRAIPASEFEIPAGFTKKKSKMFGEME